MRPQRLLHCPNLCLLITRLSAHIDVALLKSWQFCYRKYFHFKKLSVCLAYTIQCFWHYSQKSECAKNRMFLFQKKERKKRNDWPIQFPLKYSYVSSWKFIACTILLRKCTSNVHESRFPIGLVIRGIRHFIHMIFSVSINKAY